MIHRRKGRKLKRTASHRAATLSNMCTSLIMHKKIKTTLAKAKEMRRFVEPLITKSKKAYSTKSDKPEAGIHLRREANKFLQDKAAVKMLFEEIAPKVMERNGGYTRVLKMGRRFGDAAEMALIELVDFNIEQTPEKPETETKETKDTSEKKETISKQKKSAKPSAKSKTKTTTKKKKKEATE